MPVHTLGVTFHTFMDDVISGFHTYIVFFSHLNDDVIEMARRPLGLAPRHP
jgi:hypothetical protein